MNLEQKVDRKVKERDSKKLHASVSRKLYKALHVRGILFRGFDEFAERALWRELDKWDAEHPRDKP